MPVREYKCEGAESWNDVLERAKKFLNFIGETFVQGEAGKELKVLGSLVAEESKEEPKTESSGLSATVSIGQGMPKMDTIPQNEHKKVLVVTHGGYLMETFNAIKIWKHSD